MDFVKGIRNAGAYFECSCGWRSIDVEQIVEFHDDFDRAEAWVRKQHPQAFSDDDPGYWKRV